MLYQIQSNLLLSKNNSTADFLQTVRVYEWELSADSSLHDIRKFILFLL